MTCASESRNRSRRYVGYGQTCRRTQRGSARRRSGAWCRQSTKRSTELSSNLPFVADSFDEHVEEKIEKAKQEVHGYMNGVLTRAGDRAVNCTNCRSTW